MTFKIKMKEMVQIVNLLLKEGGSPTTVAIVARWVNQIEKSQIYNKQSLSIVGSYLHYLRFNANNYSKEYINKIDKLWRKIWKEAVKHYEIK